MTRRSVPSFSERSMKSPSDSATTCQRPPSKSSRSHRATPGFMRRSASPSKSSEQDRRTVGGARLQTPVRTATVSSALSAASLRPSSKRAAAGENIQEDPLETVRNHVSVVPIAGEEPHIAQHGGRSAGVHHVFPPDLRRSCPRLIELRPGTRIEPILRTDIDDPDLSVDQPEQQVGNMGRRAHTNRLSRPQQRKRLAEDPGDLTVEVRHHDRFTFEKALEIDESARAGPPGAVVVALALPRREAPTP